MGDPIPADVRTQPSRSLCRIADYERAARATIPTALYDRLFGAADDAVFLSCQNNLAGFREVQLRPSVLVDVRNRNVATTVLGQQIVTGAARADRYVQMGASGWVSSPRCGRSDAPEQS